jgi:hypothetical protein
MTRDQKWLRFFLIMSTVGAAMLVVSTIGIAVMTPIVEAEEREGWRVTGSFTQERDRVPLPRKGLASGRDFCTALYIQWTDAEGTDVGEPELIGTSRTIGFDVRGARPEVFHVGIYNAAKHIARSALQDPKLISLVEDAAVEMAHLRPGEPIPEASSGSYVCTNTKRDKAGNVVGCAGPCGSCIRVTVRAPVIL